MLRSKQPQEHYNVRNGLFIAGTNTGVGKTLVTAGILRHLRKQGLDIVPMKPVQTGGVLGAAGLSAPDLDFHLAAAGLTVTLEERALMSPYVYEPACSPHLAGRMAERCVNLDHCQACGEQLAEAHQGVLVEGAGGLMVPLNEEETQLGLVIQIGAPVLLVASIGLGTINHCLLTIETLREAEVPIAGVIFNATAPGEGEDFIGRDNPDAVAQFGAVEVLGNVPWLGEVVGDEVWDRFDANVPGLAKTASYFSPE